MTNHWISSSFSSKSQSRRIATNATRQQQQQDQQNCLFSFHNNVICDNDHDKATESTNNTNAFPMVDSTDGLSFLALDSSSELFVVDTINQDSPNCHCNFSVESSGTDVTPKQDRHVHNTHDELENQDFHLHTRFEEKPGSKQAPHSSIPSFTPPPFLLSSFHLEQEKDKCFQERNEIKYWEAMGACRFCHSSTTEEEKVEIQPPKLPTGASDPVVKQGTSFGRVGYYAQLYFHKQPILKSAKQARQKGDGDKKLLVQVQQVPIQQKLDSTHPSPQGHDHNSNIDMKERGKRMSGETKEEEEAQAPCITSSSSMSTSSNESGWSTGTDEDTAWSSSSSSSSSSWINNNGHELGKLWIGHGQSQQEPHILSPSKLWTSTSLLQADNKNQNYDPCLGDAEEVMIEFFEDEDRQALLLDPLRLEQQSWETEPLSDGASQPRNYCSRCYRGISHWLCGCLAGRRKRQFRSSSFNASSWTGCLCNCTSKNHRFSVAQMFRYWSLRD